MEKISFGYYTINNALHNYYNSDIVDEEYLNFKILDNDNYDFILYFKKCINGKEELITHYFNKNKFEKLLKEVIKNVKKLDVQHIDITKRKDVFCFNVFYNLEEKYGRIRRKR